VRSEKSEGVGAAGRAQSVWMCGVDVWCGCVVWMCGCVDIVAMGGLCGNCDLAGDRESQLLTLIALLPPPSAIAPATPSAQRPPP